MRFLKYILLGFVTLNLFNSEWSFAQNYAPKDYYLVDSLDLDQLSAEDLSLIETSLVKFHEAKNDTTKVFALNTICERMNHDDWSKYQFYQYDLVKKVLLKDNSKEVVNKLKRSLSGALNNLGIVYEIRGDINKSIKCYKESIKIDTERNDRRGLASTLNNLGFVYDKQGDIPKALEIYHESLKILEEFNDKKGMGVTLNNIGLIYKYQGDSVNALKFLLKSYEYREEVGDKNGMANSLNNIGLVYGLGNKALETHKKSLKLRESLGDKYGAAFSYINIGNIYLQRGEVEKSLMVFKKSLALRQEIGDKNGVAISHNHLGKVYLKLGDQNQAKTHLKKSMSLLKSIGYPTELQVAAELLSIVYENQAKYKDALNMYKLHIKMRDSLNNQSTQKAAIQQQAKYEYEKQKAVDDAEHEKEIAIEQEAKAKQTILTYATGGGLGLVGIFLLIVFNRLKVTRKQKNIIEHQKQEVEHQKQEVEQAHSELAEKNKEITDSIQYAKRIQNAILPPNKVVKEYLQESFILYKPKDIVAGDFYWMESLPNPSEGGANRTTGSPPLGELEGAVVLFAAADCTGHGVPGAMVSVVCNNGLNRSVREYGLTDPGKILDKTREIVVEEFRAGWQAGEKSEEEVKDGMDIALCSLSVGSNQQTVLKYAGAHNPLWLIRPNISNNGDDLKQYLSLTTDNCLLYEIKANKQPIGKFDNPEPYTTHTIELQKGDSIYIFSDGYADQFGGEKGKKMKTVNFKKLLLSIQNENMQKQKELIDEAFENWKGNLEQLDDVCVIGVKV